MNRHSGSILHKLQLGFGLAALVLAGFLAAFMDHALHTSLEAEDAQVMADQARVMLQDLAGGRFVPEAGGRPRLEKAEWRILDRQGGLWAQSRGMADLPPLPEPPRSGPPQEVEAGDGRTFSILARGWEAPRGQGGTLLLVMDRSHEEALVGHFRRTLGLGVGLSVLAAVLVARGVAAWGLAPLARITREARAIDDRHLDARLPAEQFPEELQALVGTLNAALARLQEAFERTGRLGAELAHELRTPLQNLRSTLENQALGPGCPEPQRAVLGGLLEDCDRLAALIDQILFLARAESGATPLALEPVPLSALLEEVHAFFEAAAEEAGVALRVEAEGAPVLAADRLLLTRALHNLTANALRHTPRGGAVVLGARGGGSWTEVWVADTGEGIPAAWLPRLGQPFVRPPGGAEGGLGLGLAIVSRIATMLGGGLELQSRPGEGTRATLRFPGI